MSFQLHDIRYTEDKLTHNKCSFIIGARSHGGGVPDRQVLLDADGQETRGRTSGQARKKHDRAAHCTEMSSSKRIYIEEEEFIDSILSNLLPSS